MVAAFATLLLVPLAPQEQPKWETFESSQPGSWSVSAKYPVLAADSKLKAAYNDQVRQACQDRARAFAALLESQPSTVGPHSLKVSAILSVANASVCSALLTIEQTDGAHVVKEFQPVTCLLMAGEPRAGETSLVLRRQVAFADLAREALLPALNAMRADAGLDPLTELPPGIGASFVPTQKNIAWTVPAGLAGAEPALLKVPWDKAGQWLDPNGPLTAFLPGAVRVVHIAGYAVWNVRDTLPVGALLKVSLLRERDAPLESALDSLSVPTNGPPTNFEGDLKVKDVGDDERLYVDVRVMANGRTLYRNRDTVRVPVQGWQTRREIRLDPER